MTDTGGTSAGWYHATGDPDGTHRYWDGAQWVGEPQQVQAAPTVAASFPSPGSGQAPPVYAAPAAAPTGYQRNSPNVGGLSPASYGRRVIAHLIDGGLGLLLTIAAGAVGLLLISVNEVAGVVVLVIAYFISAPFEIWNWVIRQGKTGQSLGKQQQSIRLVSDATGAPVGGGGAFGRYLVAGLLALITCGVYGLLDVLWPLWDDDNKRLTDKIVKMSVVEV